MKKVLILSGIICAISQPALANKLSADLNSESFHIQFDAIHATDGIVYSGDLLLTTDQGKYIGVAMTSNAQVGRNPQLSGGFGGKLYAVDDDYDNFGALAIGGNIKYIIPEFTDLSVATQIFYAPTVTTSADSVSLLEFTFTAEYSMFENASLYGGIRHIETERDNNSEHELDSGLHAGVRIDF